MNQIRVLTVCLGNICRSPAAQGILSSEAAKRGMNLTLDSAGTAAYHVGNLPDSRSIAALQKIAIDITDQRARQVSESDFDEFDWILAMDRDNLRNLKKIKPAKCRAKVVMFGEFTSGQTYGEVDDPYYDGEQGFIIMRQHLMDISQAFLDHLEMLNQTDS
ncbi:low molecular weight protein-tyrosine-phosphatase [Marinomonas sp. THO17]|uniref:low molecular weight protein-tyrosine-phosphatase n=1 Tax=Marinomonas sp. THO17 TaxID=3149048 RepID=UPI00336BDCBA